jgi:hypothetical protein
MKKQQGPISFLQALTDPKAAKRLDRSARFSPKGKRAKGGNVVRPVGRPASVTVERRDLDTYPGVPSLIKRRALILHPRNSRLALEGTALEIIIAPLAPATVSKIKAHLAGMNLDELTWLVELLQSKK